MTLKHIDLPVGEMSEQTGAGWNESLAFSHGAAFEDKSGLLEGVGKVSKNVRFRDLKDINEDALRYYIE